MSVTVTWHESSDGQGQEDWHLERGRSRLGPPCTDKRGSTCGKCAVPTHLPQLGGAFVNQHLPPDLCTQLRSHQAQRADPSPQLHASQAVEAVPGQGKEVGGQDQRAVPEASPHADLARRQCPGLWKVGAGEGVGTDSHVPKV